MTNMLAILLAAPQAGGNGALAFAIEVVGIGAIFYFLLIRPQQQMRKKHEKMLGAMKKGDEVMTEGGIIGEVIYVKEDRITIRTAENTRIVVARAKIARVLSTEALATSTKET